MEDDYSDILGSSSLPVRPSAARTTSLSTYLLLAMAGALGSMILYVVVVYSWNMFMKKREKSYRLSMRRRHGIPDSDHRPFNVAYAAAQRARQEREKQSARQRVNDLRPAPQRQMASEQGLRNRAVEQNVRSDSVPWPGSSRFPGQYYSSGDVPTTNATSTDLVEPNLSSRVTFADGFDTSTAPVPGGRSSSSPRKGLGSLTPASKHPLDDEGYLTDNAKKTRIEGDELIDGDEDAAWTMATLPSGSRGSKRSAGDDDVDITLRERAREKRLRKVSNEEPTVSDEDMEVDRSQPTELSSLKRGKKRDRRDAGSNFGGDESLDVVKREKKKRNKRHSDAAFKARGIKRDRDIEDDMAEEADETSPQVIRKKRGKKVVEHEEDSSTEITSDRHRRREVGEEWESNGVQFKVGLNGQRLRKALVKKSQKYPMPEDSLHPDREANIEIFVESWLTEDEYKEMKDQRRLPHQETPPKTEPSTPTTEISESPLDTSFSGKRLLWESTSATRPRSSNSFSSTSQNPQLHRSVASVGLGNTAFPRRIASTLASSSTVPTSPSLLDSTNSIGIGSPRPIRGYSKWEKQDLEAKAMSKIREANQQKKKEQERLEQEKTAPLAPPLPAPTVPAITFTKPTDDKDKGPTTTAAATSTPSFFAPAKPSPLASAPPLTAQANPPAAKDFFAKPAQPSTLSEPTKSLPISAPALTPSDKDISKTSFFPTTASSGFAPTAPPSKPALTFKFPSSAVASGDGSKTFEKPKGAGLGMGYPSGFPSSAPTTIASAPAPASSNAPLTFKLNAPKPAESTPFGEKSTPPAPQSSAFAFPTPSTPTFPSNKPPQSVDMHPPPTQAESKSEAPFKINLGYSKPTTPQPEASSQQNQVSKPTGFPAPHTTSPFKPADNPFAPKAAATIGSSTPGLSFNFNKGKETTQPTATAPAASSSFGTTTGNVFGGAASSGSGSVGGGKSLFGATPASPFGTPASTASSETKAAPSNVFGGTNVFGSTANKGGGDTKSAFGATSTGASAFGSNGTASGAFSAPQEGSAAPKPAFGGSSSSFGTSGIFGAAGQAKELDTQSKPSSSPFGAFGAPATGKEKDGESKPSPFGADTGSSSAFGAPSGKSVFGGFGTNNTVSTFGAKPAENSAQASSTSTPSVTFGGGASGGSVFGGKPTDSSGSNGSSSPFTFGSGGSSTPFGAKPAGDDSNKKGGPFSFGNAGTTPNPFGKSS